MSVDPVGRIGHIASLLVVPWPLPWPRDLALVQELASACAFGWWAFHRTSHLGGHRFAPTAVVLPEGTAWGHLDADSLGRILDRRGSVQSVLGLYRGCLALPTPAVQALERELLSGGVMFAVRRVLPVPERGQPLDAATKRESELEVLRVERVR